MSDFEYSATEIRKLLQGLFPHRRLVLSQFTFFNQIGIAKPTGSGFKRGRQCYRLEDLLSIATILALKEEGIPFKNIEVVPKIIQQNAARIFEIGEGCRLSGHGDAIVLR
jgi:DNA-binding transcriptional MerR regulator